MASVRGLSGSPTRRKLLLGSAGAAVALPAFAEDDEAARAAALQAKAAALQAIAGPSSIIARQVHGIAAGGLAKSRKPRSEI